jgi:hypothetical protein
MDIGGYVIRVWDSMAQHAHAKGKGVIGFGFGLIATIG